MKPFWAKLSQILSHKTNQAIVKTGCQRFLSTERFLLSIVFAARGFGWRCMGLNVASPPPPPPPQKKKACVAWRFWLGEQSNKGVRGQRLREEIDKTSQLHRLPAPKKSLHARFGAARICFIALCKQSDLPRFYRTLDCPSSVPGLALAPADRKFQNGRQKSTHR